AGGYGAPGAGAPRVPAAAPAGSPDPFGVRAPAGPSPHTQRQGRPQSPPRSGGGRRRLRAAADAGGGAPRARLGRGAGSRGGRGRRRLLRARRPLAPRLPDLRPGAGRVRGRPASAGSVGGADARRAGGAARRDRKRTSGGATFGIGRARRRPPPLLRPGAALVPRSDPSRERLQRAPGTAPPGTARSHRLGARPGRGAAAARGPAHHLPRRSRRAGAGDRAVGSPPAPPDRSLGPPGA